MATYRFYFRTSANKLIGVPQQAECADDAQAIRKASELLQGAPRASTGLEIWSADRLVGRVPTVKPSVG
jgi:hypothetical protein